MFIIYIYIQNCLECNDESVLQTFRNMIDSVDGADPFNCNLSKWNVLNVDEHDGMFKGCPLENKPEYQPQFEE